MAGLSFDYIGEGVAIEAEERILANVRSFFGRAGSLPFDGTPDFVISGSADAGWQISGPSLQDGVHVSDKAHLFVGLLGALEHILPRRSRSYFRMSALGWEGGSVLLAGGEPKFRALLSAWGIENGFSYSSGEVLELTDQSHVRGFPAPFILPSDIVADVSGMSRFREAPSIACDDFVVAMPQAEWLTGESPSSPHLIVRPNFVQGAALNIRLMPVEEASLMLSQAALSPSGISDASLQRLQSLASDIPAVELTCGALDQLSGVLDAIMRFVCVEKVKRRHFSRLTAALLAPVQNAVSVVPANEQQKVFEIPAKTGRKGRAARLTIGMATYDDYDGVYFSIQALRMYHADVMDEVELLIVDNHPDGACSAALKQLDGKAHNLRYIPVKDRSGTSVKNVVFEEASGDYVLCMDCHVFLVPGALKKLLAYFDENPLAGDLLQGPLVPDELDTVITHWEPKWRGGMFGIWAASMKAADLGHEPFDIPLMGMGLFACRRDAWPGFNPRFRGFGAEEGYVHEKFRQAGHRTLCLPFLGWMHRFNRPGGIPYRNRWQDRICNYMIGWQELGLPVDDMLNHMRQHVGPQCVDEALAELRAEEELLLEQFAK